MARLGPIALVKKVGTESVEDDVAGLAAQCAFSLAFALFPFLLLLLSIASFLPTRGATGPIPQEMLERMPADVQSIITTRVSEISERKSGGLLTLGALLTLYSCARGMATLVSAVNRAYDVRERRPIWHRLLVGVLLTFGGILLVLLPALWGAVGGVLAGALDRIGLTGTASAVEVLRWPVTIAGAFAWFALLFRVAPEQHGRWQLVTPGALFAAAALLAGNVGLSFYVSRVADLSATYGTVGSFIVLLLWLYLSSLVLLLGAEVNAVADEARREPPLAETKRGVAFFRPATPAGPS